MRSWLWKFLKLSTGVCAAAILLLAAWLASSADSFEGAVEQIEYRVARALKPADAPHRGLPKKYRDRVHIVMIRSEFEYGGERHVFEAPVECGYKDAGHTLSGQNEIVLLNRRQYFAKLIDDESVVLMHTPKLCGAWRSVWDPQRTGRKELYVPDNILPVYEWLPKQTDAKFRESYISESYHERDDARVRHISFSTTPGPHPVPDELILEARASTLAQPVVKTYSEPNEGRFLWRRMFAKSFPEERWRSFPELREIVEQLPEDQVLVKLDRSPASWDGYENDYFRLDTHLFRTRGVPRRSEQPGVIGESRTRTQLLKSKRYERTLYTADEAVPIFCDGDLCRIDSSQSGYIRTQHSSTLGYKKFGRFIVEIDGEQLELIEGPTGRSLLVFDRRTQTVFSLVNS